MSDIDRRGHYVLPGMRPMPPALASEGSTLRSSGATISFLSLPAVLARLALLEARDLAWRGVAHAHNLPAPPPGVSGNHSR